MAALFRRWFGGDARGDFEGLRRLCQISGVTDVFFVESQGGVAWKASSMKFEDGVAREVAHALGAATRAVAEDLRRADQGPDCVYAVYRNGMAAGWDFGQAFLLVLCSETVDLSRLRMVVNVFRDGAMKSRLLRRYFTREPATTIGLSSR